MSAPVVGIERHSAPLPTVQLAALIDENHALRKQAELDRQSREASQAEFARLNRGLNEAKDTARKISEAHGELFSLLVEERSRIGVLLDEIASAAIAAGMMDPSRRGSLDGPNAIQFLRQMKEEFERNRS